MPYPTRDEIPDAELFTDLQQSCADVVLGEMIEDPDEYQLKVLEKEKRTLQRIKDIMKDRFTQVEVINFLNDGYKRRI